MALLLQLRDRTPDQTCTAESEIRGKEDQLLLRKLNLRWRGAWTEKR